VARAVALQAIGLGFKSPYLQRMSSLTMQGKGEEDVRRPLPERRDGVREESAACLRSLKPEGVEGEAGAEL
jgi:hypothetical protein